MSAIVKLQFSDIAAKTYTPVLSYCRKLIDDGYDPATKLEVYRGEQLALTAKHIGLAAKLTVKDNSSGRPTFRLTYK